MQEENKYINNFSLNDLSLQDLYFNDFNFKLESENKLTFVNYSGNQFFKNRLWNTILTFTLIILLSIIMTLFFSGQILICIIVFILSLFFVPSLHFFYKRIKTYYTITPSGIDIRSYNNSLFINREDIYDITIEKKIKENRINDEDGEYIYYSKIFSVILQCSKPIKLPNLKENKYRFNLFFNDPKFSKLFAIIFINEAKKILNLKNKISLKKIETLKIEHFEVTKDDNFEFEINKKHHCFLFINKKVNININNNRIIHKETSFFKNKKTKIIKFNDNLSLKIFELKEEEKTDYLNDDVWFGVIIYDSYSHKKAFPIIYGISIYEALYIISKINKLRSQNIY